MLAECYRLTGADPDGNEDAMLAAHAVAEVRRMRDDADKAEAEIATLRAKLAEAKATVEGPPPSTGDPR